MRFRAGRAAVIDAARFSPVPAVAAVVILVVVVWLLDGIAADEILRFVGYELFWVIGPGVAVYELLASGTANRFRTFVLGWALGHVLEVLAFVLTAAIGARGLFTVYPLVVLVPLGAVLRWRWKQGQRRPADRAWGWQRLPTEIRAPWAWAVAGVCFLMILFVGVSYFVWTPLPGEASQVVYTPDSVFHISLAAEALHHWPLTNPNVAGEPLNYYWFVHVHYAAVSQVTGISLPVVVLGLDILPLIVLLVCELSLLGAALAQRWAAGPLAALLALLVSEVDLTKPGLADAPFNGSLPSYLVQSPTFLFGAIFFVPMVMLLCERLTAREDDWRQYALVALLAIGCGGAKGQSLPVAIGGLVVFAAVRRLRQKRFEPAPLIGLAVLTPVMIFFLIGLYGSSGGSVHLALPGAFALTQPVTATLAKIPDSFLPRAGFWASIIPVSLFFALVAPMLGLFWLLRRRGPGLAPGQWLALAMLGVSLVPLLTLSDDVRSSQFFFMFGLLAGVPVAAGGLWLFFERWRRQPESSLSGAIGFAALWSLALSALIFEVGFTLLTHTGQIPLAYLTLYLPPTVAVVALCLFARRSPQRLREQRTMYVTMAILIAAGVNAPLDFVPSVMDSLTAGRPLYITAGDGLSRGKEDDLNWVRRHSDPDDVLALSPPATPEEKAGDALNFYAAAFAERRVFLEGWGFTFEANRIGFLRVTSGAVQPFPARLRLEREAIYRGDPAAISRLADQHVAYLLIRNSDSRVSPLLRRRTRLVHSGFVFDVYAVPRQDAGRPQ